MSVLLPSPPQSEPSGRAETQAQVRTEWGIAGVAEGVTADQLRLVFDELCLGFVRALRAECECSALTAVSQVEGETVVICNGD